MENRFKFDYGIIEYKHRFNMTRSLDDYETTVLEKCVSVSLSHKSNINGTKSWFETHIIYKDTNNSPEILKLKIEDFIVKIKHMGDMSVSI